VAQRAIGAADDRGDRTAGRHLRIGEGCETGRGRATATGAGQIRARASQEEEAMSDQISATSATGGSAVGPGSLAAVFVECVQRFGGQEAFRAPSAVGWTSLTWTQTAERARELAAGLLWLGVGREDRVAIAASTRLEWVLADLAVMLAGAATTTVYPNTQASDVAFILADSGSVVAIAEDAGQVAKLRAHRADLPALRMVVVIDPSGGGDVAGDDGWVIDLDELAERGRSYLVEHPTAVEDCVAGLRPEHLSTLIYTSGTTGQPKGVELTHANWIYLGQAVEESQIVRPDQLHFLWLPLSHVFGKLLLAAQLRIGFATAVDGRIERIVDNLAEIRPAFMAAAPRVFEKVHARVTSTAMGEGGLKAKIFTWAFGIGTQAVRLEQAGRPVPAFLALQRSLADRLVFTKIRARLGGNIETLVSGSAALAPQIAEWFAAAGLPIMEGYGMTEASGGSFVNRHGAVRIGSVGPAFAGTEARIAEDGEILLRSPGVMRGYHNLVLETAKVLGGEGWLATGDVGEIDADGFLRITDRKKDLVKTSGGKYIAPSAIEGSLKAASPLIGQVVVLADGRRFPSALITLDADALASWCRENAADAGDAPGDERIRALVQAAVDQVNASLNRWEKIKQFRILPRELDVDSGELTPSLKVKRAVVAQRYADVIQVMYTQAYTRAEER
jgi:long-chain acyl-CoA synthetase